MRHTTTAGLGALALPVAALPAAWLTWLAGQSGDLAPAFTSAWLLTAALALPPVVAGLWLARKAAGTGQNLITEALRVMLAGLAGAAGTAIGAAAHLWLTTGSASPGGLARDAALALPVALLASALGHLVVFAVPVPTADAIRGAAKRFTVRALALAVATTAGGALSLAAGQPASAVAPPDSPCPDGVSQREYDVQAINVDIPLNRFGDHDFKGRMYALTEALPAIRAEEKSQKVSIGLRKDPIQPLVIRANEGDCVTITYTNNASGGDFGMHIDGLVFLNDSSGDAIGRNPASNPPQGQTRTYRYYVPMDATLEGAHYLHPGPGFRDFVNHGLFGAVVVEPPGSTYVDPNAVDEAHAVTPNSGWEMTIKPYGRPSFRENVQLYHEIGNEDEKDAIVNANGANLPFVDPHTDAYRPGTRAMNYRSEPFFDRLERAEKQEAHSYGSYTFGDPATPMPRGYLGDPTKFRILHAGTEMFHVFHMHGGGIRWRFNPVADKSYDYADTGLNKYPVSESGSERLDSQAFGPGESYNLEIEGGTGGVQQGAGDFLFHCHIAEHYVAGMWSFWRSYDTRQPEFAPLADRTDPPTAVDSTALIGKTINGQKITAANLDDWIRPQLPPQGVRKSAQDATVWPWGVNPAKPAQYLGEPEDTTDYPDYYNTVPGHPTALPIDTFVGNRPVLLFNPLNGRPAYPMMRPHLGIRPPFSPNGHSGAPYLGEMGATTPRTVGKVDPYAGRADAICPNKRADGTATGLRRFNIVAIERSMPVTPKDVDPVGQVFALAHDKDAILAGTKPMEPLAVRANIGDCVATTLTSELTDKNAAGGFSQVNMHIHHVQFDTQASDGVITGMSYEQAVRPYKAEDPQLVADTNAGGTVLRMSDVAKFQTGTWIGVGLGTDGPKAVGTINAAASGSGPEIRMITAIDPVAKTLTLNTPLAGDHPAGQWAGVEFVQSRWFPDVDLDNIFWHDHVDGIHTWAHGLVSQLIIEPKDSTFHDPRTGAEADSGAIVDVRTEHPLAPSLGVTGSFREVALWTIDKGFGSSNDSLINMRANPLPDRTDVTDASLRFSSYKWGDPITPLPRAYAGDPVVIRTVNVGPTVDTFHIDGHNFTIDPRYADDAGKSEGSTTDTIHYGISEKYTAILGGGAGGKNHTPGDYLYFNGIDRRLTDGAWGIMRVLPGKVTSNKADPNYLQPLPGTTPATAGPLPTQTGGRPPVAQTALSPCQPGAHGRTFDVTAVPVKHALNGGKYAFVPSKQAASVLAGSSKPDPLLMHVAVGDCVTVRVTNSSGAGRVSFHLAGLTTDSASSGAAVGWNPDSTIAEGGTRVYTYSADDAESAGGSITDLAGNGLNKSGLYGSFTVAPKGATFTDPLTGGETNLGASVVVHVPGKSDYRDFSVIMADDDPQIGASFMPYPIDIKKRDNAVINYRNAPRDDSRGDAFSSLVNGDPATPLMQSYAGDPVVVHALVAPGSEQTHSFSLGGMSWSTDPLLGNGQSVESEGVGPYEMVTAKILGGAGGQGKKAGDYYYGELRRPFVRGGMWGLQRVLAKPAVCPPAGDLLCLTVPAPVAPVVMITKAPPAVSGSRDLAFEFTSDVHGSAFQCSLATGTGADQFIPCRSPETYKVTADGAYTVKVRAIDSDRTVGAAVAKTVTVDTTGPAVTSSFAGGKVTLTANEPAALFYSLDGGEPTAVYGKPFALTASALVRYRAVDALGNVSAIGEQRYDVAAIPGKDKTPPQIVSAPVAALTPGGVVSSAGVPVTVSWAATDPSGIEKYVLRQSVDGVWGPPVTVTSASLGMTLAPGHQYAFGIQAKDRAGNTTPSQVIGVGRRLAMVEETAAQLTGTWSIASNPGGQARFASVAGSSADFTVPSAASIALVTASGKGNGLAKVTVDGAEQELDLFAPLAVTRQQRILATGLGSGTHTVRVDVLGTKNPAATGSRIDVDGLVLLW